MLWSTSILKYQTYCDIETSSTPSSAIYCYIFCFYSNCNQLMAYITEEWASSGTVHNCLLTYITKAISGLLYTECFTISCQNFRKLFKWQFSVSRAMGRRKWHVSWNVQASVCVVSMCRKECTSKITAPPNADQYMTVQHIFLVVVFNATEFNVWRYKKNLVSKCKVHICEGLL